LAIVPEKFKLAVGFVHLTYGVHVLSVSENPKISTQSPRFTALLAIVDDVTKEFSYVTVLYLLISLKVN
jgi:hypothetical protein